MEDLIKASEAALDVVERYALKGEDVQNKAIELRASLDRVTKKCWQTTTFT